MLWLKNRSFSSMLASYTLVTTSTDGKIMLWSERHNLTHPVRGYLLGRKKKKELAILGGNSISVNPADPEMIVVGTDSGACYRCKVSAGLNLFGQESGPFDQMPQSLRWKQEASQVMNLITNKKGMENVLKIVERYCIDQGMKEIEAYHIFDSKPNI